MTTRLPAMFSCAAVFISDRRSRIATNLGCTILEYTLVMTISRGVTASSARVSCQLTKKKKIRVEVNMITQSTTW